MAKETKPATQPAQPPARPPVNPPPPPAPPTGKPSLFVSAQNIAVKLRVCLWGWEGTHKTRTALTFPRPAVISVDGLAEIYAPEFPAARFFFAPTIEAVERGLTEVINDKGESYDTVVIDSLTPLYDSLKDEYQGRVKDGYAGYLQRTDRDRINIRMKRLYNLIRACPVHVVIIVRATDEFAGQGNQLTRVGDKTDADKFLGYQSHFILHMTGDGAATITKYQGYEINEAKVKDVSWSAFWSPIAAKLGAGDDPNDIRTGGGKALFVNYWNGRGLKNSQIVEALGVKSSIEWNDGRAAADERIEAYAKTKGWFDEPETKTDPAKGEPPPDDGKPRVNPFGGQTPNGSESP